MTTGSRMGIALFIILSMTACSKDKSPTGPTVIKGSGNIVSDTRVVAPVNSVDLRVPGTVNLLPFPTQVLAVRVDDNILSSISTRDSSGILIVEVAPGSAISDYTLAVDLALPDLEGVVMRSAGTIAGAGFDIDALSIILPGAGTVNLAVNAGAISSVLAGAGSIILAGSADTQEIIHSGTGVVHAFGLRSDSTDVVLSGVGPVEITADSSLSVVISGTGSVFYKGSPTLDVVITGTGSVINAN